MRNLFIGISIAIALAVGVVAFLIININTLVKDAIEDVGSEVLGVPVTVDSVAVSFLDGSGEIHGLKVANPGGYDTPQAIVIGSMKIAIDKASIGADRLRIHEVAIDAPEITYEGNLKTSNLQTLQEHAAGLSAPEETGGEAVADETGIQIDHFEINDAKLGVNLDPINKTLNLTLSHLDMGNIGKDEHLTAAQVLARVMRELNRNVIPLVRENASGLRSQLKEQAQDIGEQADKAKEKVNELKSLFDK